MATSTKVVDIVDLVCSFSFADFFIVRSKFYSSKELMGKYTSILLELLDSLYKTRGVSFGALFVKMPFFFFIFAFGTIVLVSKKIRISFENLTKVQ